MIGGDSRVVRVLVKQEERLLCRIQGRWDIGFERIDEDTQEMEEFLVVKELKGLQAFVIQDEKQQPWESVQ